MFAKFVRAAALVAICASLQAANLLDDPGFESATGGGQVSNSSWTLNVNVPDAVNSAAQFQTAAFAANSGATGVWFKSFAGDAAGTQAQATLSQTVAAGAGEYGLTFFAKLEEFFSAAAMSVILSSNMGDSATFDILALAANDGNWAQHGIFGFTASAGTTMLTVQAVMQDGFDPGMNPQLLLLDDFDLSQTATVPEPGTLLLTGLGAVWLSTRLRRAA